MKKQNNSKKDADRDYEIKFWKDWLKADTLKRLDLVEKLPLFRMCLQMKDEKAWRESFATLINGYLEDLENACVIEYGKK